MRPSLADQFPECLVTHQGSHFYVAFAYTMQLQSDMVDLQKKRWYFFLWDEHNIDHLERHGIVPDEAEEVFFNRYFIAKNKGRRQPPRFRIDGVTNSHRNLRLIVEDLGKNVARVITGWDL